MLPYSFLKPRVPKGSQCHQYKYLQHLHHQLSSTVQHSIGIRNHSEERDVPQTRQLQMAQQPLKETQRLLWQCRFLYRGFCPREASSMLKDHPGETRSSQSVLWHLKSISRILQEGKPAIYCVQQITSHFPLLFICTALETTERVGSVNNQLLLAPVSHPYSSGDY